MKFWKSFSFFFIYPFTMMLVGFFSGAVFMDWFSPRSELVPERTQEREEEEAEPGWQRIQGGTGSVSEQDAEEDAGGGIANPSVADAGSSEPEKKKPDREDEASTDRASDGNADLLEASLLGGKLDADTSYVLEETDLRNESVVETTWKLPAKYIGMNREEFLEAMDLYEAAPPLSELERGFVGLEVLSFSPERVVVRMDYDYVQPSASFYLVVENNYVVVYLDDRKTVYMYTDILLTDLPDEVQQDIIHWMYVPDEESLYNFLENHTS